MWEPAGKGELIHPILRKASMHGLRDTRYTEPVNHWINRLFLNKFSVVMSTFILLCIHVCVERHEIDAEPASSREPVD